MRYGSEIKNTYRLHELHSDENIFWPVVEFTENGHRVLFTPRPMHIAKYLLLLRIVNNSFVKVSMYDGSAGRDDAQQQNLIGVLQSVSDYTYFQNICFDFASATDFVWSMHF
jgi:hypothetical protein